MRYYKVVIKRVWHCEISDANFATLALDLPTS